MENLELYLIAAAIGGVLTKIFLPNKVTSPFFQDVVMRNIQEGKRVAICVDTEATIFEMVENRIRITRGQTDFFKETYDDILDTVQSVQPSESDKTVSENP